MKIYISIGLILSVLVIFYVTAVDRRTLTWMDVLMFTLYTLFWPVFVVMAVFRISLRKL